MTTRNEEAVAAITSLRDSVAAMPLGHPPLAVGLTTSGVWDSLGRRCILGWVDDAGRSCSSIASTLAVVEERGRTAETCEALEGALWRVDAAREKLEAVFVLSFGVPSLELYKSGVKFEPNAMAIKIKLEQLAEDHEAATELAQCGKQLAEHAAVRIRNQLSHQLAPIESAEPLCLIDLAHLRRGSIIGWTGGPFYVEGALESGDIGADALWTRAVAAVGECFALLVRSMEAMAELIVAAAVLEPPQPVYRDEDTGRVSLTDPRSTDALGRIRNERPPGC
jgi:hypothetical protein